MVSGFLTSPKDQLRIRSGEARPILMPSKSSVWRCWLNRFSRSFIFYLQFRRRSLLVQLDVDRERTDFLDQDVEGLRHAGHHFVLAIDDVLVHLVAALHV